MIASKLFKTIDNNSDFDYYSNTKDGAFVIFRNTNTIDYVDSCREEFAYSFNDNTNFLGFACKDCDVKKVNKFFTYIENKLKLTPKNRLVFYKTDVDNLIRIKIPKFWNECVVKRGLFTLFLRCASVYYNGKNFDSAIKNYNLTNQCKNAIELFLSGYTRLNYSPLYDGVYDLEDNDNGPLQFVETFKNKSIKVLRNGYLLKG